MTSNTQCPAGGVDQYWLNGTQLFSPFGLTTTDYCSDACPPNWNHSADLECYEATTVTAINPVNGEVAGSLSDSAPAGFGYASNPFGIAPRGNGALPAPFDHCVSNGPNQFCEFGMVNTVPTSNCCVTNVGAVLSTTGFLNSSLVTNTCTSANSETTGCYPCTAFTSAAVVGQATTTQAGGASYVTFYQCLPVVVNVAFTVTAENNCDSGGGTPSLTYSLWNELGTELVSGSVTPGSAPGEPVPLAIGEFVVVNGSVPCCCLGTHHENASVAVTHQQVWEAILQYNEANPATAVNPNDFTINISLVGKPDCSGASCRQNTVAMNLTCTADGIPVDLFCPAVSVSEFAMVD